MSLKWMNWMAGLVGLIGLSPLAAPQLLAFPYETVISRHVVYSEQPIDASLGEIVNAADALAGKSPLASSRVLNQPIFLTDGGWRWEWLALNNHMAFALSRPGTEAVVVNKSDVEADMVHNSSSIANRRSLHGTLAHEMSHGLIRAHFGMFADHRYPADLREGYCDYVAGGGSLTDAQARTLIATGGDVPALTYWRGRKKVEAELAASHGNVDALFANWHD